MSSDSLSEISRTPLLEHEHRSETAKFLHAAAYSALQTPLTGLTQLIDKTAGTDWLPSVQLLSAPPSDERRSIPASFGSALGSLGHMALMVAAAHKAIPLTNLESGFNRFMLTGAMGGAYGVLFCPVEERDNFVDGKFRHFTSSYMAMAGSSVVNSLCNAVPLRELSVTIARAGAMGAAAFGSDLLISQDRSKSFISDTRLNGLYAYRPEQRR